MEQYIYDERGGLWYERDGDYYIPCLKLPEINIGIWGERYLTYIREHKKLLHTRLMINGTLYTHLAEINKQAEEMFSELVNQMKTREDITEQLKAENQLEWVRRMNNIRHRANEISLYFACGSDLYVVCNHIPSEPNWNSKCCHL